MRAGMLRHRILLQEERVADDNDGADDVSYLDVATVPASITTAGGNEFWAAKQLTPELTHQVEIRYRTGVTAGMRFLYGDSVLRIEAAMDPEGRRVRLLCMCKELVRAAEA